MRAAWSIVWLVAGCAGAGMVSGEGQEAPPAQYSGEFGWSYDRGIASAESARHPAPIDVPVPSARRLAATKTAMIDQPDRLTASVRFCVDVEGRTREVALAGEGNDPRLDEILVETVRGWTFTPALLGGRLVEACSSATFEMAFR